MVMHARDIPMPPWTVYASLSHSIHIDILPLDPPKWGRSGSYLFVLCQQ